MQIIPQSDGTFRVLSNFNKRTFTTLKQAFSFCRYMGCTPEVLA